MRTFLKRLLARRDRADRAVRRPFRGHMRRPHGVAWLALALCACGVDTTGPDITGFYELVAVNGSPLPAVVAESEETVTRVMEGHIEAHPKSCIMVFVNQVTFTEFVADPVKNVRLCRWGWEDGKIVFTDLDRLGETVATLEGTRLTLDDRARNTLEFELRQ